MKYKLQDIIDIEHFQNLQDRLNEIYSFPSAIIDNDGNILTATAWQRICTDFHRKNEETQKHCLKSDQYILSHLDDAKPAVSYRCPHGLVDNAAPIIIEGIHYGNFFTGQFFLEEPDISFFRSQAGKFGFDEEEYIGAVREVPIWSQKQLDNYLYFIKGLIAVIAESGQKRLKQIESDRLVQESDERAKTILKTAMDGYWLVDVNGRIIEVNETYCRMSGYSEDEILCMSIPDLEAAERADETQDHIQKIQHLGEDRFESVHRRKDGTTFDVEVSVQYRSVEGGQFVTFLRDVTERKATESEREKLESGLAQSQRLESVGRLAGGVAHDFNNMLSIITGNAEIALLSVDSKNPLHAIIHEILQASERSADLTKQLLAFARKQTISPKVLDLNDTIDNMLTMLRRLIGENIDLHWLPASGLGMIRMDPSQIDQIFTNLIVNASDSIPNVGTISIETKNIEITRDFCMGHPGYIPGEYVQIAVRDNGTGMEAETLSSIFEPFFTTKEMGKGTGLGLALVHGIVTQNNGFIDVQSDPDKGTIFLIHLPRCDGDTIRAEPAVPTKHDSAGSETILLVEDEPAILTMIGMMLENCGYTVISAASPGKALNIATEFTDAIHVLFTDVVMPEMNGRDLATRLKSIFPEIKCLFISGYTADVIARHGILERDIDFIQKPFSMHELSAKIGEILRQV